MMAYHDDAYQNCNPDYTREYNKLEKDKPRILLVVMKGSYKIQDTTRNLWC